MLVRAAVVGRKPPLAMAVVELGEIPKSLEMREEICSKTANLQPPRPQFRDGSLEDGWKKVSLFKKKLLFLSPSFPCIPITCSVSCPVQLGSRKLRHLFFLLTFSAKGIDHVFIVAGVGWRRQGSPRGHGFPRRDKDRCCFYSCKIDPAIPPLANRRHVWAGGGRGGVGGWTFYK